MKKLSAIVSVTLSLFVLIASSSFTVNMHFCGDHIRSIALLDQAAPCPMETKAPLCHNQACADTCCDDSQVVFEGQDFNYQFHEFTAHWALGWVADIPFITTIAPTHRVSVIKNHFAYKPPLLERDIPVLKQSFLI
jgi:hypothetical protein